MEACIYGSFVISGVLLGRLYDYSLGRHEYLAGAHIARECNIFMPTMHWSHYSLACCRYHHLPMLQPDISSNHPVV